MPSSNMPDLDLERYPRLDVSEVRLLWVNDWWDGPIEAAAIHRDERCLVRLHDVDVLATNAPWRWVLFSLSREQEAELRRQHDYFAYHVGEHMCCHDDAHATFDEPRKFERFYEVQRSWAPLDLSTLPVRGWIDSIPAPERKGGGFK